MNGTAKGMVPRQGAVLYVVLGVILVITAMLTALFHLPGGVMRVAQMKVVELQKIYDGESALVAYLNGFPEDYFANEPWNKKLPSVIRGQQGPWADLLTNVETNGDSKWLHLLTGLRYDSLSREEKNRRITAFAKTLEDSFKSLDEVSKKSGNRRLLGIAKNENLVVQDGDLLVDWTGNASVCNFMTSGNMELRGDAFFDTLRLYALGNILITGDVKIRWLEAYSGANFEISRKATYWGMAVSRQNFSLQSGEAEPALLPVLEDDPAVLFVPIRGRLQW